MPAPPDPPADPVLEAERIYVQALAGVAEGESLDLDALCAAHPGHAEPLRRLHELWREVSRELRGAGPGTSLAERLRQRFGAAAEPGISLQGSPEPASDFSGEVLSRLSGRQPTSTRYKLEGEVARGGMGAILRVWDEDLRRHLAMKVVLGKGEPSETGGTPPIPTATLARFLEEAQVTGQLDHPGIVPVHELGLDAEGQVYFTMKLVKGRTLKAVFEELARGEGGWTQTRVLSLILRVCEAMAYAHDKQVIHRDLKPANVMVGKFGEVYVMDWGLAKILGREDGKDLRVKPDPFLMTSEVRSDRKDHVGEAPDSPLFTMDGDVVGTPAYMSPEQAAGEVSAMGPPSDVYAIGAMLYHLLAGHMPYVPPGARLNNYAIWSHVQGGPPRPLQEVAPTLPAELVAICEKAMARDAAARYANTSELAEDLSAYIEGRVVRAYETGAWAEARKWFGRNRPLAIALCAALVLAAGGLTGVSLVQAHGRRLAEEERSIAQGERERADAKTREAQAQRDRAEGNERLAREQTAKLLRLSDVKVLQELEERAARLWPAYPENSAALEAWIERARALAANLPLHRATLEEMRARARVWSAEERANDRDAHPRAAELGELQAELDGLIAQMEEGRLEGRALEEADARATELEPRLAELRTLVEARRTWSFDDPGETWQHDVLTELTAALAALESGLLAEDALTAGHGWSVPRRLAFARELEAGFGAGGVHERAWSEALPAIAATYPGLDLKPQMGLAPLGPDPRSGLWEFAHLMTGAPARRGADGQLVLTEQTGAVLVLLPGGTFSMGAQDIAAGLANYDPRARNEEAPVREVTLSPYFLSKYELTQGQWRRLTGHNPSLHGPEGSWGSSWLSSGAAPSLLHPVEQVSWRACWTWLPRAGLSLPSEAQWERAARAGTGSVYWSGADLASLQGVANLSDRYGKTHGNEVWTVWEEELDDGSTVHSPVGSYRANPFGLHDVHGNLWEWCLDGYDAEFYRRGPAVDPLAPAGGAEYRVARGGSFLQSALSARSSYRFHLAPGFADSDLGVRPARVIAE